MINVPSTLNILLQHACSLIPFVIVLPNTRQALVKKLIHIWSTSSNERNRVISFVCLFHLIREHRKEMIGVVLRDSLMDQFYELVILYIVHYAHHVTYPELVYPLTLKLQENANLIEERRQKSGLNVKHIKQMDNWLEQSLQQSI
ncbi:unnamed protein product [Rotaria sp. Silwood2]|nr:unnamed protein product [Rotaria sp. Silwood2]CAF4122620.1 unnamed protein product [Rotaria sp. Silwood2]CAF4222376.1 unnamed protein product [Rotaria sp. Silwood2]